MNPELDKQIIARVKELCLPAPSIKDVNAFGVGFSKFLAGEAILKVIDRPDFRMEVNFIPVKK